MPPNDNEPRRYYECNDCQERTVTDEYLDSCPGCGGNVTNIAVPRER
jgi:Zn finger protein HypA/HybF involved in hydrogenase expression